MPESPERPEFRFTPPEDLKGLSAQTIFDLYDILYKWGYVYVDTQERRFSLEDTGLGFPIYISGSAMPENISMFITKSTVPEHGLYIMDIYSEKADEEDKDLIFWDKDLTVEEANRVVAVIDAKAVQRGLIDLNTGERIPLTAEEAYVWKSEPPYYRVSEVFSERGNAMPVFPGQDPHELLSHFDHPEELVIHENPVGAVIFKKEDLLYLKRREEIVVEILKEKGIDLNNPEVTDRPTIDEVLEIRKEVDKRLKEEFKED